jgi:hypothetical protein
MNSHFGSWSLGGLPNLQKAIVGVKTQWIEEFFYIIEKLLKRRYLKWVCMTHSDIETQVMPKKKDGNQIGSLTPDH